MSFYLFRLHYSAWRYVKAKQWLKISLDSLDSLDPQSQSPRRFQLVWWQKRLLEEASERDESERVANTFKRALEREKTKASQHIMETEVQKKLKHELKLEEENLTPARRAELQRQLRLEEGRLQIEKKKGDLLNRINGLLSAERSIEGHTKPAKFDLTAAQMVLMPDDLVDCILQSEFHLANSKYDDALKSLKPCWEMISVNGFCWDGRLYSQKRAVLIQEGKCHLELGSEIYKKAIADTSRGPATLKYIESVKSYYRDVEKINDEAIIDELCKPLLWVDSRTPDYNLEDTLRHVEEAIKCYQQCLTLSFDPGSNATSRLDDLQRLATALTSKVALFFGQMCLGKISPQVYIEEWIAAWNALTNWVELSSRLLHASLERRHILRGSNDGEVFKDLHELLSEKMYMITVHPALAEHEAFQREGLMVLQLIISERARAQTLLLGDGLLTKAARDDLLKFSLDNNFAWESILRSLKACGPGAVFVSLNAVLKWNIYVIAVSIEGDQTRICENRVDDEDALKLRGSLKKAVDLLSTYGTKKFPRSEPLTELDAYLKTLGDFLIEPLVKIGMLKPEQKLIFCASSYLANIPFPILRRGGRYLFQDHDISVTPSLRVLHPSWKRYQGLQELPLLAGKAAGVVLANPKYSSSSEQKELPGTSKEADSICKLFEGDHPVESLRRKHASVKCLLDRAQLPSNESSQGFIHIAAHAEASVAYPKGVLILASERFHADSDSEDNRDGDEDSDYDSEEETENSNAAMRLSAERISESEFDWCARLVVLSACDSVHGKFYSEGVHNLPRAFMLAGVPCIVASQWKVADAVAAELMESFYTCLREGKEVASAMRFAMCAMLDKNHFLLDFAPFLVWGWPAVRLPHELQQDSSGSSLSAES